MTPPIPKVVPVEPRCFHCKGTVGVISRDGVPVCHDCIRELVQVAEAERMRIEMERLHPEVMRPDDPREGQWR
jgi:hypothetical protein